MTIVLSISPGWAGFHFGSAVGKGSWNPWVGVLHAGHGTPGDSSIAFLRLVITALGFVGFMVLLASASGIRHRFFLLAQTG
ncbi:Uncharacterised protein [Mycobacteroides abscessus subsp. abscessus]|nr:Uncharacterised protein [Mycobacteroides abscessus subsp. abscessus]